MARFSLTLRGRSADVTVHADSVKELRSLAVEFRALLEELEGQSAAPEARASRRKRRGSSEAALALEAIESLLVPTGFFARPRRTSEVREEIERLTGYKLQSRKVSQALGYLYKRGRLRRMGSKGDYVYVSV
ncbi:MAG: hypothetical protein ABDH63_03475 [Candidatus Caldarchaeales archaeon]